MVFRNNKCVNISTIKYSVICERNYSYEDQNINKILPNSLANPFQTNPRTSVSTTRTPTAKSKTSCLDHFSKFRLSICYSTGGITEGITQPDWRYKYIDYVYGCCGRVAHCSCPIPNNHRCINLHLRVPLQKIFHYVIFFLHYIADEILYKRCLGIWMYKCTDQLVRFFC